MILFKKSLLTFLVLSLLSTNIVLPLHDFSNPFELRYRLEPNGTIFRTEPPSLFESVFCIVCAIGFMAGMTLLVKQEVKRKKSEDRISAQHHLLKRTQEFLQNIESKLNAELYQLCLIETKDKIREEASKELISLIEDYFGRMNSSEYLEQIHAKKEKCITLLKECKECIKDLTPSCLLRWSRELKIVVYTDDFIQVKKKLKKLKKILTSLEQTA